ncbi:uncharacterized protein LOC129945950 [Eupeodes corollae]|uniref:uncharacterized protein LOC129945950 n=1 Tax=Eupeodes corollae TaxID=290404 RepID=UPI002493697F|nr:uncharacterized protein LOC129945950 [Eupeodes corollae]XP_055911910.1 uncharacterized protein LOC129945950 [Eupeodes corollae]
MTGPKVQGRPSIRKDTPTRNVNSSKNRKSSHEREDLNQSSFINESQQSEVSLDEQSSQTDYFEKRNESCINERTSSPLRRRRERSEDLKSSFKANQNNSITLESAIVEQQSNTYKAVIILVVLLGTVFIPIFIAQKNGIRECSFDKLKAKYPKESDKLWMHLKYGNEYILNNEGDEPAVFLFLHHAKRIADKLVDEIARTSADCYGSPPAIKKVDLNTREAIEDYGHIIASYKKTVKEGNVILIVNLNEIPGEAAKALHSICDSVTPLVKKVIILLTLTTKQHNADQNVIETAENELKKLWQGKMKANELDPIITRVTDQVFLLKSD